MNPLFQKIILDQLRKQRQASGSESVSDAYLEKELRRLEVGLTHLVKDITLIVAGVFSAGFGLKGFLLPNDFIDGGVTGISLLTALVTGISLPILLVLINAPFIFMGFTQIGRAFGIKSIAAILLLAVVVGLVEYPLITDDKLLVAVFGGFFLGAGIGLAVRGGSVLDGTEVLAVWLSKRTGLSIGDVILLFNIMIFSVAAWLLSIETALYSILTYLSASKTVDFIVEGVDEYMGVNIISPYYEEIRQMIISELGRGVTIFPARGGYGESSKELNEHRVVFTVITRMELARLKRKVATIDPRAFIYVVPIQDIAGGVIKRKALKH